MRRTNVTAAAVGSILAMVTLGASASEVETTETPSSPEASSEASSGWVERAAFTTAVVDREPRDSIDSLTNDHVEVYFFTELRGFGGQTVVHRWEYDGKTMAEVPFEVGGPRWRTYSSKRLQPGWTGQWTASVVDESGRVLSSESFRYSEVASQPTTTAPAKVDGY